MFVPIQRRWRDGERSVANFLSALNESSTLKSLKRATRRLNQYHQLLAYRKEQLKMQQKNMRAQRTRTLIQVGGVVQKSGLLDTFSIQLGEDLQDFESRPKGYALLGFLYDALNQTNYTDTNCAHWEHMGKRLLKE